MVPVEAGRLLREGSSRRGKWVELWAKGEKKQIMETNSTRSNSGFHAQCEARVFNSECSGMWHIG